MAAIRKILFSAILAVCLEGAASAKVSLDLVTNYLSQSGKGGPQSYDGSGDQELTIFEPVLYVTSQIDHNTSLFGSVVYDLLSSASNKAFDTGTGASKGGWQDRKGVDAGYSKRKGSWMFTPTAGYSTELSYKSLHGGVNVQKFMAEDNFVLSGGVFYYADETKPWNLTAGAFDKFRSKTTRSVNLSATQILSEREIGLVGVSYTRQSGYLEGTRNTVYSVAASTRIAEAMPGEREKYTFTARYIRSLRENLALHADYRYYEDSWNIRAHTMEPSVARSFADEKGALRVFYRLYTQKAAKYYAHSFASAQPNMTSDSDLAAYTANEAGAQFSYALEDWDALGMSDWTWGGTALYYSRSNNLKAVILQVTLGAKF